MDVVRCVDDFDSGKATERATLTDYGEGGRDYRLATNNGG